MAEVSEDWTLSCFSCARSRVHQILTAPVIPRRPRDRGRVVPRESDLLAKTGRLWLKRRRFWRGHVPPVPIERQPKGLAKRGKRPFAGVGFRGFERNVVTSPGDEPCPSPVP